jgi:hypothetical protein
MRRVADAEKVLRHAPGVPVVTRVFEQSDADRLAKCGANPILNPQAGADKFMEWFEKSGRANRASGNGKA